MAEYIEQAGPPDPRQKPILVRPKATLAQAEARLRAERVPVDATLALLRKHEGFKSKPYRDSKKLWTIGIGTKIGDGSDAALAASKYRGTEISEADALALAKKDMLAKAELAASADQLGPVFNELAPETLAQVVSGYYRGDLSGSPKTKALLRERKFGEAAKEFLNSAEYKAEKEKKSGVAGRMEEIAAALRAEQKRREPASFQQAVENRLSQVR